MTIGERIKRRRIGLGLTLEDVSLKVGVSRQTIQRYESGVISSIPSDRIEQLALALHCAPSDLMGWTDVDISTPFKYHYIPRGISAGAFEDVEAVSEYEKVPIPDFMLGKYAKNKDLVLMHVNGESMNRVIANGAIIAVLTNLDKGAYRDGDIIIAINSGECTIKRFYNDYKNQMICLYPDSTDNSFHPILVPYDSEDFRIFGKVVIYSVVL